MENKIEDYCIISSSSREKLSDLVIKMTKNGWECLGGAFGGRFDLGSFDFFQTMVKRCPSKEQK